MHITFYDVEKAFDRVSLENKTYILTEENVLLQMTYETVQKYWEKKSKREGAVGKRNFSHV